MHLRSISVKGFKSFPNRTRLEFGPGVSVIVGPNGSGKSNVTDAVLWALGEQSPLAVRGQTMKDVIFAGGHGIKGSSSAEVEVVIDNGDGALATDFSEISILRKLDRDGDGEYRLNGARCRLVDVLDVLSDTGLGKEMHSVVSQGRVEAIVLSRPRERRLLIEEAAGLGKHRKRRRRAQLKLERTQENLDRALDVEREARSRLKPLKRQAEAAELHARLERQSLEARMELAREGVRAIRADLATAESRAAGARSEREEAERLLAAVAERRETAEQAFAAHGSARERLQGRLYAARSAAERIAMRLERAREQGAAADERARRRRAQLDLLEGELDSAGRRDRRRRRDPAGADGGDRARARRARRRPPGAARRRAGRPGGRAGRGRRARGGAGRRRRRAAPGARRGRVRRRRGARTARRDAERAVESARAAAARTGSELAAVNRFVRGASGAPDGDQAARREPACRSAASSWRWPRRSGRGSRPGSSRSSARARSCSTRPASAAAARWCPHAPAAAAAAGARSPRDRGCRAYTRSRRARSGAGAAAASRIARSAFASPTRPPAGTDFTPTTGKRLAVVPRSNVPSLATAVGPGAARLHRGDRLVGVDDGFAGRSGSRRWARRLRTTG